MIPRTVLDDTVHPMTLTLAELMAMRMAFGMLVGMMKDNAAIAENCWAVIDDLLQVNPGTLNTLGDKLTAAHPIAVDMPAVMTLLAGRCPPHAELN